jgi:hypothetical protein
MQIDPSEASLLRSLEEELLQPEVRSSADRVDRLLADAFIEFGSSGRVFDKAQVIEALQHEPSDPTTRVLLTDFAARQLAPGVVLVTYRTLLSGPGAPPGYTLRSSIWELAKGQWQMVFHQGAPGAVDP